MKKAILLLFVVFSESLSLEMILSKSGYLMKSLSILLIFLAFTKVGLSQSIPKEGLYLGQTPPGNEPEVFKLEVTPGSFPAERIAVSNDGSEIYYSEIKSYYPVTGAKLKYYKYEKNKWTGPFVLFEEYWSPALSTSGDTMFFEKNHNTYYSVKNRSEWSNPKLCFNSIDSAHYLQVTNKGNYYVSARSKSSVGLSDWSKLHIIGKDTSASSLGFPINNVSENQDFYIAKDESYMITCPGGPISISYPDKNGKWLNSRRLNKKINFGISGWGAYVTADQRYLFYTTGTKMDYSDVKIYWVSMGNIIDSMIHTNLPPYVKNVPKPQTAIVGQMFSFIIPDDAFCDEDGNTIINEVLLLDGKPLPSWLVFDAKTKTLSGTPAEADNIVLRINAYDEKKEMAAFRFIISVQNK